MKIAIQTLNVLAAITCGVALVACSPSAAAVESAPDLAAKPAVPAAPSSGAVAPTQVMAGTSEVKLSAPLDVTLRSTAKSGTVVITLGLKAGADIPRAVSRIVLPPGVKLLSGQPQMNIPFLERGAVREHRVTIEVPSTGEFTIFAGVDCHISSGVLLHKGAPELVLGQ